MLVGSCGNELYLAAVRRISSCDMYSNFVVYKPVCGTVLREIRKVEIYIPSQTM
jgi:hypothetical protein